MKKLLLPFCALLVTFSAAPNLPFSGGTAAAQGLTTPHISDDGRQHARSNADTKEKRGDRTDAWQAQYPEHQGYNHSPAGAYIPADQPRPTYYNCWKHADSFSANSRPSYKGHGERQLRELGQEPKLDRRNDLVAVPNAPEAVSVNQSTTQPLEITDVSQEVEQESHGHPFKNFARGTELKMGARLNGLTTNLMNKLLH